MSDRAGIVVQQQSGPNGFSAFIPAPLPPAPPVLMEGDLALLHETAAHALGKLDGVSARLDPERLLYMYVRKEAVLTSQIEGTQSTLSDLLEYENATAPGTPLDDVREVSRYVDALFYAIEEIRTGTLPLCLRLLRNAHARLMSDGRGSTQAPGEFRRSQNWVGGTRPGNATYVPPPPHEVIPALGNLERYLHDEFGSTPVLLKAGIAHAQFETIHPFLDGNGRIGRLLISLMLVVDGALTQPYFYISLYFNKNRADYYDALRRVRTHGDWEGWLRFFLIGVGAIAQEATQTADALSNLFTSDRVKVEALGRAAPSALKVYDLMRNRIVVSASRVVEESELTWPTVLAALRRLEELDIANEVSGKKRYRLYQYTSQLEILNRETHLP
jgi:cell filamentation protein, protein adenylyltransferase